MSYEPVFDFTDRSVPGITEAIRQAENQLPGLVFNYPPIAVWDYIDTPTRPPEALWRGSTRYSNNLYVHIPFCRQKCSFCYYSVVPGAPNDMIDEYIDCLEREAEMYSKVAHADTQFDTLFIGGGTPGLLSPEQLDRLMRRVVQQFNIENVYEANLEFSPDTVTREKIDVVRAQASIGFRWESKASTKKFSEWRGATRLIRRAS